MRLSIGELLLALTMLALPVRATDPAKPVADTFNLAPPGTVQLQDWLGDKLGLCVNHRVWNQDPEKFIAFLRHHNDTDNWRGEYWGKWYTAAVLDYASQPSAERLAQLENVAREVVTTQDPDGYLGPYDVQHRLTTWDV